MLSVGTFSQYAAIVLLFLAAIGCGIVILIEILRNENPNPFALSVVTLVLGNASTMLGYHQSSSNISSAQNRVVENIK